MYKGISFIFHIVSIVIGLYDKITLKNEILKVVLAYVYQILSCKPLKKRCQLKSEVFYILYICNENNFIENYKFKIMKKLLVTSSIIGFFIFILGFSSPASISTINEKSTTYINDTTKVCCNIVKVCCDTSKCIKLCDPAKCPKVCIQKCCKIDKK